MKNHVLLLIYYYLSKICQARDWKKLWPHRIESRWPWFCFPKCLYQY